MLAKKNFKIVFVPNTSAKFKEMPYI